MAGTLVPGFYPIYSKEGNWSGHVYIDAFSCINPSDHQKLLHLEKETQMLKDKLDKLSREYSLLTERYKTIIDLIVRADQSSTNTSTNTSTNNQHASTRKINDDTDYSSIWKDSDSEGDNDSS